MFVNKIVFLVTISRGIKFGTAETLKDRKHPMIMSAIKHVVALYSKRGFRVSDAHTVNDFEPMRANLMDAKVNLNVVSNSEHIPEIERHIRTMKDRARCMYNSVPFKKMAAIVHDRGNGDLSYILAEHVPTNRWNIKSD